MAIDSDQAGGPVLGPAGSAVLGELAARHPELSATGAVTALRAAAELLLNCWQSGGSLFLCGNGGSHSDALHVAGEAVKSFERPRPVDPDFASAPAIAASPYRDALVGGLQVGLPAFTLGANGSVASAIANDIPVPHIGLAQELSALARPGDVLWALSTSGGSRSVVLAATVARAIGVGVIAFTGLGPAGTAAGEDPAAGRDAAGPHATAAGRDAAGTDMVQPEGARLADVAVVAPARATAEVQGWHVQMYHCLCGVVEAELFPAPAEEAEARGR